MRRVLGGFSSDGDSVLVTGPDAGWWLACGADMDRSLTGITMPPATGTAVWYRRTPHSRRDIIHPGARLAAGASSLAVITVTAANPAGRPAAGRVPAAFIRNSARAAAVALRPGGYLAVIIADTVPDGWPQRARRDGHCVRAPRIPGMLPHRHIIMARATGRAADRQRARNREQGHRMHPAWHLLIYVKPGQVIPFPRSRQGR